MATREEIDWGLRTLIRQRTGEEGTKYLYDFSKAIREYLDSQGVKIKVERELPPTPEILKDSYGLPLGTRLYKEVADHLVQAGYTATKPLIQEGFG